jgi:hypothetical protein
MIAQSRAARVRGVPMVPLVAFFGLVGRMPIMAIAKGGHAGFASGRAASDLGVRRRMEAVEPRGREQTRGCAGDGPKKASTGERVKIFH